MSSKYESGLYNIENELDDDRVHRGKKRAADDMEGHPATMSEPSTSALSSTPLRKSKKGVTKHCPVCNDDIPVRLLQSHVAFELEKLEELAKQVPNDVELPDILDNTSTPGAGPSSRRGAAIRARKSITNHNSSSSTASAATASSIVEAEKTIKLLQRHRRARHAKTREFSKAVLEDLDRRLRATTSTAGAEGTQQCPICQLHIAMFEGGETLAEHVDRCLRETAASEEHRLAERQLEEQRRLSSASNAEEVYEMNGETRIRLTSLTGFAGTGFNIRNPAEQDVDDDLDIEGADEDEFGEAQFDEADVLGTDSRSQAGGDEIDVDDDEGGPSSSLLLPSNAPDSGVDLPPARARTLRDLVAEGKVSRNGVQEVLASVGKGKGVVNDNQPSAPGAHDAQSELVRNSEGLDAAVDAAISLGDKHALILALQRKIQLMESAAIPSESSIVPLQHHSHSHSLADASFSTTCRICLEPYTDPTCSVACWHVFCNSCWLRCLGTTSLCPICKHISLASNLRRVYL